MFFAISTKRRGQKISWTIIIIPKKKAKGCLQFSKESLLFVQQTESSGSEARFFPHYIFLPVWHAYSTATTHFIIIIMFTITKSVRFFPSLNPVKSKRRIWSKFWSNMWTCYCSSDSFLSLHQLISLVDSQSLLLSSLTFSLIFSPERPHDHTRRHTRHFSMCRYVYLLFSYLFSFTEIVMGMLSASHFELTWQFKRTTKQWSGQSFFLNRSW